MLTIRPRTTTLVLALGPLLLSACSGSSNPASSSPATQAPAIQVPSPVTDGNQDNSSSSPAGSIGTDLTLESVSAQMVNLDDQREEFVEYCFGSSIQKIAGPETGFSLAGLKPSNRVQASDARLVEGDDRCVLAGFAAGTDVNSYTIGIVGNSVVMDRSGEVNIVDSVPLSGGADVRGVGGTSAPELVRVKIDRTLDQASYFFDDKQLDTAGANAAGFGYYTKDGTQVTAKTVESVNDNVVIVSFGNNGADQVREAVRYFVMPEAVKDRQGMGNTLGAAGDATVVPDLVSVKRTDSSGSQYDFRFDEPVQREDASKFVLYTSDAQRLAASSVTRPSPDIVRATFARAMDFPQKIARAAVADKAVVSLNSSMPGNTIGAASLPRAGSGTGPTSGPDLLEVTLEPSTGQATFVFDATLKDDRVQAGNFFLVTDSGAVSAARDIVNVGGQGGVTGNKVVLLFDEPVAMAAALASVSGQAVADQTGEPNPATTISVG